MEEHEARRERIRQDRLMRLNEQERKRQEDEMKRRLVLTKNDEEDRRRKLMVYAKWTKDDQMRRARMEDRRRRKEYEQSKKVSDGKEAKRSGDIQSEIRVTDDGRCSWFTVNSLQIFSTHVHIW